MSAMIRDIASAVGVCPVLQGENTLLLHLNDADTFLSECAKRGVVVLGIDVFDIVPGGVRPDMNLIADFSTLQRLPEIERSSRSIEEAKLFLKHVPRGERLLDFELMLS